MPRNWLQRLNCSHWYRIAVVVGGIACSTRWWSIAWLVLWWTLGVYVLKYQSFPIGVALVVVPLVVLVGAYVGVAVFCLWLGTGLPTAEHRPVTSNELTPGNVPLRLPEAREEQSEREEGGEEWD